MEDKLFTSPKGHIPVLAKTLAEQISLPQDAAMVDATVGHGGHSFLFGQSLGSAGVIVGLDVDKKSINCAESRLKSLSCKVILLHSNFSEITARLTEQGIENVDFILADLGVCSRQLTDNKMGLSFQTNMPLDMRFDKRLKTTAADIINNSDEKTLADLIFKFGEDRASRRIARFILEHRKNQKITTTSQLASIVCKAMGQGPRKRPGKIHPATRTFQALRIAVNHELEALEKLLDSVPLLLKENGRVAIISFHSLEDRIVKMNFKENAAKGIYSIITKKPVVATKEEIAENPRSRSAKLRIAEKLAV